MILIYDTETTGFPKGNLPLDHESQPYIVQLAMELCGDDGRTAASFCAVIDNGVDIPEKASAVHGITRERAAEIGIAPALADECFTSFYNRADLIVAHNADFDKKLVEIAMARRFASPKYTLQKPFFCTMTTAAPIVNIPPTERMLAAGFNKPKSPKLEECIRHFFGEDLPGAHDAMVDVAACKRVYLQLKALESQAAS